MNEIDVFESLRPSVRPLAPAQVDAMRAQLFGGTASAIGLLDRPTELDRHDDADTAVAVELIPADRANNLDGDRGGYADGDGDFGLDGNFERGNFERDHDRDLDAGSDAGSDAGFEHDFEAELITLAPRPRRRERDTRRWRVSAAAAAVVALGVGGIWAFGTSRVDAPAPATQPDSQPDSQGTADAAPATPPEWYTTIRPLLPDGFDQIALTQASPEVVGFKAFRNGTRQMLDVTVVLEPGYELKPTADVPTLDDEQGSYFESTSSVTLTTPDDRLVSVRCALSPIGGGAVGSVSMADSVRDYCGDGFDNLGIDAPARRALTAQLATDLTSADVTPAFGAPVSGPVDASATSIVASFVGDDRLLFGDEQHFGVLRSTNLSSEPTDAVASDTELTVIHGVWAPRAADTAPANRIDGPTPPRARFHLYDDVAVAFVVADDGTGYHVLTSNLADDHLDRLGSLLDELVVAGSDIPAGDADTAADVNAADVNASDVGATAVPRTDPATVNLGTTTTTLPDGPISLLDQVMNNDAVIVINASGVAMVGQSLTDALAASGYPTLDPLTGELVDESVIYARPDAFVNVDDVGAAVGVARGEDFRGQVLAGVVTHEQVTDANLIIVLGRDLADAPWEDVAPPLVPSTTTGRLLVLDATTTSRGTQQARDLAASLRAAGVEIVDVVPAARSLPETMLMPIGASNRWTFAVAELARIGGFDGWTSNFYDGELPADVTAVLVVGEPAP